MSLETSPDSAASRRSQPELQDGDKTSDQISKQIAPEKLQSVTLTAGAQTEVATEGFNQGFKPVPANIDKFVDNESIGSGLGKEDLSKIVKSAVSAGDVERRQVATFLYDHFDDVRSLSANGGEKISRDDLTLYSQMLKQSEKSVAAGKFNWSGLQDVHDQHENQAGSLLPAAGLLSGLYAGNKVFKAAMYNPLSVVATMETVYANPRAYLIAKTAVRAATYLGGMYLGAEAGGMIDRGMQEGSVRRHFVDEAEPAMKRLLQG